MFMTDLRETIGTETFLSEMSAWHADQKPLMRGSQASTTLKPAFPSFMEKESTCVEHLPSFTSGNHSHHRTKTARGKLTNENAVSVSPEQGPLKHFVLRWCYAGAQRHCFKCASDSQTFLSSRQRKNMCFHKGCAYWNKRARVCVSDELWHHAVLWQV